MHADVDSVGRLAIELHEFTARGALGWLRVPDSYDVHALRERIRGIIENTDAAVFVAEAADELIGFVELHVEEAEAGPLTVPVRRGHIQSLVVAASARGRGVGTLLMAAADGWASERGAA
jgi:GNAT superfamily N-acetyltransferase